MEHIKGNWKVMTFAFATGFVIANIAWLFGVVPDAISFFGFEYPIALPTNSPQIAPDLCDYYGLEISEPPGGYVLENGQARVGGTVTELPPYGSVWLMTIADGSPVSYWPQSLVIVNPTTKEWDGIVHSSHDTTVAVVVLGDDAQALFGYFRQVLDTAISQGAQYPGLTQLTEDTQMCDTATVRRP